MIVGAFGLNKESKVRSTDYEHDSKRIVYLIDVMMYNRSSNQNRYESFQLQKLSQ